MKSGALRSLGIVVGPFDDFAARKASGAQHKGGAAAPDMKIPEEADAQPAPPGYRWASRLWRTLPDGTRDYAAYHGKTSFRFLVPASSRVRSPKR